MTIENDKLGANAAPSDKKEWTTPQFMRLDILDTKSGTNQGFDGPLGS